MRGCLILSVLALAGCGEHLGWNPNYNFAPTRYGEYRVAREMALVTAAESPKTIPVARPFYAPTGADIAGRSPVPIPPTMGISTVRVVKKVQTVPARPVTVQTVPVQAVPVRPVPVTGQAAPVQAVPVRPVPVQAAPVRDPNAPIVIVPPTMRQGDQPPL